MTTVDQRTLGYGSFVLGAVFLIVGLFDLAAVGQPISSPIPALDRWLMSTFGRTGVRLILVVFWFFFGVLFLRYGSRSLTRARKIALWSVVTVVIFIAVALLLRSLSDFIGTKAMMTEVILATVSMQRPIDTFYEKNKRLPRHAKEAQLDLTGSKYIERFHYDAERGEIRAVVQRVGPAVNGKSFVIRAQPRAGKLEWICGSYDMPLKYLPARCNWGPPES